MALIKCRDCKREISTDADRCIHCGAIQDEALRKVNNLKKRYAKFISGMFNGI